MKAFHNPHHHLHHPKQELFRGRLVPSHEVPERLNQVLLAWQQRALGALHTAALHSDSLHAAIHRVHSERYTHFLAGAWNGWVDLDPANAEHDVLPSLWPLPNRHGFRTDAPLQNFAARLGTFAFDAGTPLTAGTWAAACGGAACALAAVHEVLGGAASAFALTRPPGHHAGPDYFGGYCFLNNAAIAAQALRDGGKRRVAVLDVDFHHGNGTQTIFYERADVFTVSLHGDPRTEYPFFLGHADERGAAAGEGSNLNLPLPRGTGFMPWMRALDLALNAVKAAGADALVVPLGVDTFEGDPVSGFTLKTTDYTAIGRVLAGIELPTVFTFEGGYAVQALGENTLNLLEAFEQEVA